MTACRKTVIRLLWEQETEGSTPSMPTIVIPIDEDPGNIHLDIWILTHIIENPWTRKITLNKKIMAIWELQQKKHPGKTLIENNHYYSRAIIVDDSIPNDKIILCA